MHFSAMIQILRPFLVAAAVLLPALAARAAPVCPAPSMQRLDLGATRAALAAGRPVTIVAFGSSSTEGYGASSPAHAYPQRLAVWLARLVPGARFEVLNRGIGGQTVTEMLARLDRDVIAARPTLVIWQDGANEALRGVDPAAFRRQLDEGVARLRAIGADVVLMDNQRAPRILAAAHHADYDAILAALAKQQPGVSLYSRDALMRAWAADGISGPEVVGPDGLHQTDFGYDCLAQSLARTMAAALPETIRTAGR